MSAKVPARSVLRPPAKKTPAITDEEKAKLARDRKNLSIALRHAYLIEHRKKLEASVLDAITALIDFPAAAAFTSKEAQAFVALVQPFQPSDYDSLVEERHADNRCGYVLCANPPRSKALGESAVWKLKKGMSDYCTNTCAARSFYIRAQLSEVPSWERVPEQQPDIQLHEDHRPAEDDTAARRANRAARIDEWRKKVVDDEELAMERGEKTTSLRPKQVMTESIVEKTIPSSKPSAPQLENVHHDLIEGYQPRPINRSHKPIAHDSDDDEKDDD